jgi:glyoxylase-like metal-dependent hydrolase (beta-lactamase superfamily II)
LLGTNAPSYPSGQFANREEEHIMDGSLTPPLHFPVATAPGAGETIRIAPGVEWLHMPLPFALDHINLWLLEDGPGWTIVDTGYAMVETMVRWERIFGERLGGLPVTRIIVTHHHPDHIGLAAWLAKRWQAPLWTTEKEWLSARLMTCGPDDSGTLRHDFARPAGLGEAASKLFAEHHQGYRRSVPSVPLSFQRLADRQIIEIGGREWSVIVGEGHSPELACLYCAETGVLIAGDQILPKILPNVSVQAHEPNGDPLSRFLRSLDMLRAAIPPRTLVLPSHNLPFSGLHLRIDALAAHPTEPGARKSSTRARVLRARWSYSRCCSGGLSTGIRCLLRWARRSPIYTI